MNQHQSSVDQVKLPRRQRIADDVVLSNLQVQPGGMLEELRVEIGGQYVPGAAYAFGEPGRDRTSAASHFQTVPTRRDATLFEVQNRAAIEHLGKRFKARRGLASRVVEQIRC